MHRRRLFLGNLPTLKSKQRSCKIHWLGQITLRFRSRVVGGPGSGLTPNRRSSVRVRVQSCSKSLLSTITSPERNHTGGNVSKWDASVPTTRQNASFEVHRCDMPLTLTMSSLFFVFLLKMKSIPTSTNDTPKAVMCAYNICLKITNIHLL